MSNGMTPDALLEQAANAAAEEILRVIYGDDLQGCAVSVDSISAVVRETLKARSESDRAMGELYEKGLEAIHLLSTPPADGHELTPPELQSLLSDRLDKIRTLAAKIMALSASSRVQPGGEGTPGI